MRRLGAGEPARDLTHRAGRQAERIDQAPQLLVRGPCHRGERIQREQEPSRLLLVDVEHEDRDLVFAEQL